MSTEPRYAWSTSTHLDDVANEEKKISINVSVEELESCPSPHAKMTANAGSSGGRDESLERTDGQPVVRRLAVREQRLEASRTPLDVKGDIPRESGGRRRKGVVDDGSAEEGEEEGGLAEVVRVDLPAPPSRENVDDVREEGR